MSLSKFEKRLRQHISDDHIKQYNIKIAYRFDDFKTDMKQLIRKLSKSKYVEIYEKIIFDYIENINDTDFMEAIDRDYNSINNKYPELNYNIKELFHMEQLAHKIKFMCAVLDKITTKNIVNNLKRELILNVKYGILARLTEFIFQHYRVCFFLNFIKVVAIGVNKLNKKTKEKVLIFQEILFEYLNINGVFNMKFFQLDAFINYKKMDSIESIEQYRAKYEQRCTKMMKLIYEAVCMSIKEDLDDQNIEMNSFMYTMFENKDAFDMILDKVVRRLAQAIYMCYPRNEMEELNRYLSVMYEKYYVDDLYESSDVFVKDLCNGFFRYVGLSTLTSMVDFPEIFGKILFNLPINNLVQKFLVENKMNEDSLYNFIKNNPDINIFNILQDFNKAKMLGLMIDMSKDRLNTTFMRYLLIYIRYLSKNKDEIYSYFFPKIE